MKTAHKSITIPQLLDSLLSADVMYSDEYLRKAHKAFMVQCYLADKEPEDAEAAQAMKQLDSDAYAVRIAFGNVSAVTDMEALNKLYDEFLASVVYMLDTLDPAMIGYLKPGFEA